ADAAQEDHDLVPEPLPQAGFDPLGQRRLAATAGGEDDVAGGAKGGDVLAPDPLGRRDKLRALDPAILAQVDPAQEGGVAVHASQRTRRGGTHATGPRRAGAMSMEAPRFELGSADAVRGSLQV